jgi:CAAX amino terminal protease family.
MTKLRQVHWGRVGVFLAITWGWSVLVAGALYLIGQRSLDDATAPWWVSPLLTVVFLPAPLVAARLLERRDPQPDRLRTEFAAGWWRHWLSLVLITAVGLIVLVAALVAATWLAGNLLDRPDAGTVLFSQPDIVSSILTHRPSTDAAGVAALSAVTPGLWGFLAIAVAATVLAAASVNGLFAFGAEYGWRGWLSDELSPLGTFWSTLLVGILSGLWYAPLVLLGHGYPGYAVLGVGFMVAWNVPVAFVLWRLRQWQGSLLAPAMAHGAINGLIGFFWVVMAGGHPLLAAPMGLIGIAVIAALAGVFWLATAPAVRAARADAAAAA